MPTNWRAVYNRLFALINLQPSNEYFGGPRFIRKVQDVVPDFPPYDEFMAQRNRELKSTTRKDYFYDILMDLDETQRAQLVRNILDEVGNSNAAVAAEIRGLMAGEAAVPNAVVPNDAWNAPRLNGYLNEIDNAIAGGQLDRAVALSYTCLEGFYKAYHRAQIGDNPPNDLIDLAKAVWASIRGQAGDYPDEVLALIKSTAHAVDRAREQVFRVPLRRRGCPVVGDVCS